MSSDLDKLKKSISNIKKVLTKAPVKTFTFKKLPYSLKNPDSLLTKQFRLFILGYGGL